MFRLKIVQTIKIELTVDCKRDIAGDSSDSKITVALL